ncbi:MAG TPA: metal-dependent hydrolase [Burkholderiales bacterium]|nr:metal-dependent hydrolase [Burkholderiales bacterium]
MDTLTHALSGALLARATAPQHAARRSVPRRVAAGFFACAAPDLDFIIGFVGPAEYLLSHRGVTHSLILLPAWALLYSWLLAKLLREPGGWRAFYGVTALALLVHIVGDLITSFGTMILAPFSDWRAALGTTFIIDLWFSGIILAGLAFSAWFYRSRIPAVAASVMLAGYVGFQYVQKQRALELGAQHAKASAIPDARITVHPRPVSPFNWTVFVSDEDAHRFAHVNLVRKEPRRYQPGDGFIARIDSPYMPAEQAIWVRRARYGETNQALIKEAWNAEALSFFRWFAALPAFDGLSEGSACVWFTDLRFLTPGRETMPFRYRVCRERPGAPWRLAIS